MTAQRERNLRHLLLLSLIACGLSMARAQEAGVENVTTTKVTVVWTGPEFIVDSQGKSETFRLPTTDEIYSADARRPSLPGIEALSFQSVMAIRSMTKEDESHFSFPDIQDRQIRLFKNKPVELWKVEVTIVIDGEQAKKIFWKQRP